jgi:hypothetical protein
VSLTEQELPNALEHVTYEWWMLWEVAIWLSVTDAVAADLAAARPDPTLGVTLGVKSAAGVRNPKRRRSSEA